MSVLIATALFSAFVLLCRILRIGTRLPKVPWWAGEGWVSNVFGPGLVVLFAFGGGSVVHAVFHWQEQAFGPTVAAEAAAILAIAAILWVLIGRMQLGRAPKPVKPAPSPLAGEARSTPRPAPPARQKAA